MIPFGLTVGCLITDFLKETSQGAFRSSEGKGLKMKGQLLAIGGFFVVVVKLVSTYFVIQKWVFLLHVVNGGMMQVLSLWRSLLEENGGYGGNRLFMQDGFSAADAASQVLQGTKFFVSFAQLTTLLSVCSFTAIAKSSIACGS